VSEPLLTQGGPSYRLQQAIGIGGPRLSRRLLRALILSAIAFVPLVVLGYVQGLDLPPDARRALLLDYAVYARFLLAVPAFLFAEGTVDARCRLVLQQFLDTHLVPEGQRKAFTAGLQQVVRLRDHPLPELALLAAAYLRSRSTVEAAVSLGHPTWWAPNIPDSSALSAAGWWYVLVSLPLYHFLLFLWLWRLGLWALALAKIARLDLQLRASHPDRMGGLGFLNLSLGPFGTVLFGLGSAYGAVALQELVHQEATLESLAPYLIGGVVLSVALIAAPLLVFMNKLIVFRRQATISYTALATRYTALFEQKWIGSSTAAEDPDLLGTGDIQSLADLGNSFATVRQLRTIPIDPYALIPLVIATALPMLPAVVVAVGLHSLVSMIVKSVL